MNKLQGRSARALNAATTALNTMLHTADSDDLDHAFSEWGCPRPMGRFVIVHGIVISQSPDVEARFLVVDDEGVPENGWRYQASVVKRGGDWSVEWMKPQCTACFGQGVIEDAGIEICGVCGGDGWGVLGSRSYRYVVRELAGTRT